MAGSYSPEQICSEALGILGQAPITDLNATANKNAVLCSQVFYQTRDALLESYNWGFATWREMLEASADAPAFGYDYKFALPADCLRVQRANDKAITYVIESGFLLSDTEEVGIVYTRRINESGYMSALFAECLAARIATKIALPILKKASAVQLAEGLFQTGISKARLTDAIQDNEADLTPEEKSSWLSARL